MFRAEKWHFSNSKAVNSEFSSLTIYIVRNEDATKQIVDDIHHPSNSALTTAW